MHRRSFLFLSILCLFFISLYVFCKIESKDSFVDKKTKICIADNEDYPAFCHLAANDEYYFNEFKRSWAFNLVHESFTYEEGRDCLILMLSRYPKFLEKVEAFRANDLYGNPRTFKYPFVGNFSPTTLHYMKVAGDLKQIFGNLNGLTIVEIGGGYGGQCKILSDLFQFEKYILIDLPEPLELAKKYVQKHGISNVLFYTFDEIPFLKSTDLVLSNYTFTECEKKLQKKMIQNILMGSKRGYLICNFYPKKFGVSSLSKQQLLKPLKEYRFNLRELPEEPKTGKENFVLIWKNHLMEK